MQLYSSFISPPKPCVQVLDMVTEAQPNIRQLPFEDFVNIMCRTLPSNNSNSVDEEVRATFPLFASSATITPSSLQEAMSSLGMPISTLLSNEMIAECDLDGDGLVSISDFCSTNNVAKP